MFDPNGNRSQDDEQIQDTVKSNNTLVVVKKSLPKEVPNITLDPLFVRINEIPVFGPIIDENVKKFPWSKSNSPSLSSRINSKPLIKIGHLYNGYLRRNTEIVVTDQSLLTKKIKQVDVELGKMMKIFTTRQKQYAHHASKFGQIPEACKSLSKAQSTLQNLLNFVQLLNHQLPLDDQLEEFHWSPDDDATISTSITT